MRSADETVALLRASVERALADAGAAEADRAVPLRHESGESASGGAKSTILQKSPSNLNINDLKVAITNEGGDFTDIATGSGLKARLVERLSSMRAGNAAASSISTLANARG